MPEDFRMALEEHLKVAFRWSIELPMCLEDVADPVGVETAAVSATGTTIATDEASSSADSESEEGDAATGCCCCCIS